MLGFHRGIAGTGVLCLAVLALAGCGRDNRQTASREKTADETASRDREAGNTIQRITSEPQNFYGKTVTVSGDVSKVMNPHAVEISGGGNNDMLVFSKKAFTDYAHRNITKDDTVQVTGTVEPFNMDKIRREIGFNLDNRTFADWNDKPVLIAKDITLSSSQGAAGQGGANRENPAPAGQRRPRTAPQY